MHTFKDYFSESRLMKTTKDVSDAIAHYKKAGEIMNPDFVALKDSISYLLNYRGEASPKDAALAIVRSNRDKSTYDEDVDELYYTSLTSLASLGKIEKLIKKIEKKNVPEYKSMIEKFHTHLKVWKPIAEDMKLLKGKVVKVTQKRAEAKAAAATSMAKKFTDSSSLIRIFEGHLAEYKAMAEKRAREIVQRRLETLKQHGMDLNAIVPRVNTKADIEKRNAFASFTTPKGVDSTRGVNIRVVDHAKVERFVKLNVEGAEEAYRGFMQKMIEKIGKTVIDAKMSGNIWTNAVLTVKTIDGEQQVWNTQMIINFSKYGKMFNQFPSRRKK